MNVKIAGLFACLLCALGFADKASATLITFDTDAGGTPLAAPPIFSQASPLTTFYASLGATWAGGGAVLNQNGGFGVSGFSAPNFLAYNSTANFNGGGAVQNSDTVTFATPQGTVSFLVGANAAPGLTFTATAFDLAMNIVDLQPITLSPSLQLLTLSGSAIASVAYSSQNAVFVIDNLNFEAALQVPEPGSVAIFAIALAGLGFMGRQHRG